MKQQDVVLRNRQPQSDDTLNVDVYGLHVGDRYRIDRSRPNDRRASSVATWSVASLLRRMLDEAHKRRLAPLDIGTIGVEQQG